MKIKETDEYKYLLLKTKKETAEIIDQAGPAFKKRFRVQIGQYFAEFMDQWEDEDVETDSEGVEEAEVEATQENLQ